jgi:PAS domain S-box-containing protein
MIARMMPPGERPGTGPQGEPKGDARERQLLASLQLAEAGFRQFIDACPDAIFVRRDQAILHVNEALLRLLGYARAEVLGRDPVDVFVHAEHRELVLEHRVRSPDHTDLREHHWVRRDGTLVAVEVVGITVAFEGAPARIVLARDLTERRRLQDRLFVAGHMASVGTLAAGMAHEINNPLASVMANLHLLAEALRAPPGELAELLADALAGAERVRVIVESLQTFARGDAERVERLSLPRVVDEAVVLLVDELRQRARLVEDHRGSPEVEANPGRLLQVVVNLLTNAVQAIPPGQADQHEILVRTGTDAAGRAVLSVRDSGVGIPAERLPRIFEPFFSTKEPGGGAGLGLSIAHNIVTALGGEIAVESRAGAGSTFTVTLPAAPG